MELQPPYSAAYVYSNPSTPWSPREAFLKYFQYLILGYMSNVITMPSKQSIICVQGVIY